MESRSMAVILREVLEPLVEEEGFELVSLTYVPGRSGRLSLAIDHPDGITLENCERVSRAVSAYLDREDPIEHHYSLEVSSPGPKRALQKKDDYRRFAGRKVRLRCTEALAGRRNFSGIIGESRPDGVELLLDDGSVVTIAWGKIAQANLRES